ncbi:MAG: mobile mystery protein B [Mycobacteriales bacterium]|nr:mobile mystery protein B [Mycobacteriales bacterium]
MTEPTGPHESAWSGATPLDPDDAAGLALTWVATRADLDAAEQANILAALRRPRWRRPPTSTLLTDTAVRRLHQDMFGDVWTWAGTYRRYEASIGIDPHHISVAVRDLVLDAAYWFGGAAAMTPDAAAWTFHHRLVSIHPFPNGNGRHSRLLTDLLLRAKGEQPFTWGRAGRDLDGNVRDTYLAALRAADTGDYEPLSRFVRA